MPDIINHKDIASAITALVWYNLIGDNMFITINNKKLPIKKCINFKDRLLGLMFKKEITEGYLFPKCNSIHTFFMKKPIDVIMTDRNNRIIYMHANLKPWKIIWPKKNVYNTIELPVNSTKLFSLNEKVKIS